ncbi:hypothetical protein GCM10007301_38070 [Azorhizobium oxalatiphilum]|uniref:Uncharacterized protein n=2 Tax=Azorhizobium oxalatiphilum TaxID=980631 RepID=A0A917FG57_9HYPH|nr:hypothetical protein GCM10007301_38070 [Azorhizobium oxalatiphilum]
MRNGIAFFLLALLWPAACGAGTFQWLVPSRYELPDGATSSEPNFFDLQPDAIETGSARCDIMAVVQEGGVYEIVADCSNERRRGRTTFSIRPLNAYRILVEIKSGSSLPGPINPTLYEREWHPTRVDAHE